MCQMGLISSLLTSPISGPGRGVFWVAQQVLEAAEQEIFDPVAIRRALRALEVRLEAGELDEATFEEAELILLQRLRDAKR